MIISPSSNYWYSYGNAHANCLLSNGHDLRLSFFHNFILFKSTIWIFSGISPKLVK